MTRTEFLREQTLSGANKCRRTPFTQNSVSDMDCGIAERKANALKLLFETMPVYIGDKELIVGTRTLFSPKPGNEDGSDPFEYTLETPVKYINKRDIELFGCDQSYVNKTHFCPDFSIVLKKGIDGIISDAENKKLDKGLNTVNLDFLNGVITAYQGLKTLILRYESEALSLAENSFDEEKAELLEIARICAKVSGQRPDSFREAIQLLWFVHLGTIIESFQFVNYGRLDVILNEYLKDTDRDFAKQLIECLLLKMYDQVDLVTTYLKNYAAQLVVTLGGVLPDGENAVNDVTMIFLDAIKTVHLPEPEFNLRVSSKNPPEYLDKAAELTVSGCNHVSYYNDDLFVESMIRSGVPARFARDYAFDLCQDINIPGKSDFYLLGSTSLGYLLMDFLAENRDFDSFEGLLSSFKAYMSIDIATNINGYNDAEKHLSLYAEGKFDEYFTGIKQGKPVDCNGKSPMAPLPLLSALYEGCIDQALDINLNPLPVKERGYFFGTAVEAINSLSAIKEIVFDKALYTLDEIYEACLNDFDGEQGRMIRSLLLNSPKWGNDDDFVDAIAKDILEHGLKECSKYKTYSGGQVLAGIHQPHPVLTGEGLMATPDGRAYGAPVAVTLTPANGTMKNGPTALASASKIDPMLVQWNYCVMVNYFTSVFNGNGGKEIFKSLLSGYFRSGGLQHQPNVSSVEEMKKAQLEPDKYKDLIVRLWGVSAHFVDLSKELQDEMIARFS